MVPRRVDSGNHQQSINRDGILPRRFNYSSILRLIICMLNVNICYERTSTAYILLHDEKHMVLILKILYIGTKLLGQNERIYAFSIVLNFISYLKCLNVSLVSILQRFGHANKLLNSYHKILLKLDFLGDRAYYFKNCSIYNIVCHNAHFLILGADYGNIKLIINWYFLNFHILKDFIRVHQRGIFIASLRLSGKKCGRRIVFTE